MLLRPVDEDGDVLPVLTLAGMVTDGESVADLIRDRLELYAGDWWENRNLGNEVLEMMRESRLTEADAAALSSYLAEYVRETRGVRDVTEAAWRISGGQFVWGCRVVTEYGNAEVRYEL